VIKTDTLYLLAAYLDRRPDVGIVGCKVLNSDGTLQLASRRSFPKLVVALPRLLGLHKIFPKNRVFGKYNLTHIDDNLIQDVDAISGSCMMLSKKIVDRVGSFDERFFLYFEDTDYCYRVKKNGFRVVYNPNTQIIHYKGESTKYSHSFSTEAFHQSAYRFFEKYSHEFRWWHVYKWLVLLAIVFRKFTGYLLTHRTTIISWGIDSTIILAAFYGSMVLWYPYHFKIPVTLNFAVEHWRLWLTYLFSWHAIAIWFSLYKKNNLSYGRSLVVSSISFIVVATITYFISIFAYSRMVLLITFIISAFFQALWRIMIHVLYRKQRIKLSHIPPLFTRNAIILGHPEKAENISDLLNQSPTLFYHVVGIISDIKPAVDKAKLTYFGPLSQLAFQVKHHDINEIIILEESYSVSDIIEQIQSLSGMNIVFKFIPDGHHYLIGKGVVDNIGGIPLVDIEFPLFDRLHLVAKRIFDFLLSSILIFMTAPFHLWYGALRKITKKTVWASGHKSIVLLEFKSEISLIRKLPYLFSILSGDISFVGSQVVDYTLPDPGVLIKPGITGLSQLKSVPIRDANATFEQYYIQNQNLIFDLEILLKSILRI